MENEGSRDSSEHGRSFTFQDKSIKKITKIKKWGRVSLAVGYDG